jgi:hypothetical protein
MLELVLSAYNILKKTMSSLTDNSNANNNNEVHFAEKYTIKKQLGIILY